MGSNFFDLPPEDQQNSLTAFASELLKEYGIYGAKISCINFEFNATFSVETESGTKYALRININSTRTVGNMKGEIEWVRHLNRISGIHTPTPISTLDDQYIVSGLHADSGQTLYGVMYSWLEGEELGDEPTLSQLHDLIMKFTIDLYQNSPVHIIHADMHGWNLMWNEGQLSIFDFDDCGYGVEAQDLAVALYYLDTPEQEEALLNGYKSVRPLPTYSANAMKALLLQRRLLLLNYLFETKNQEHKEMLPAYLEKSLERVSTFLTDVRR